MNRNKAIIKVSIFGIIVNVILVVFKMIIGLLSNSIAIIMDAINNLSDALSSIITIVGTKLSEKRPNKKHPFGYGRIEYFSSVMIAIIVLFAGVTSFKECLEKIFHPEISNYTITSLTIIIVAVLVKFFFGRYVKRMGNKLNSNSLVASGMDAINDSFLSLSTFIAAIISIIWNISLDGYLGIIISLFIIKSAIEMLKETVDDMIGIRSSSEITNNIKKIIGTYKEVMGVYDLTLHNYGPNKIIATAHIQIDDKLTAKDIHLLTRHIEIDIYNKYGIILTIGIYASNNDKKYLQIKKDIYNLIKEYSNIIEIHGFYVDEEYKIISFDIIFNFDEKNPKIVVDEIRNKLSSKYSEYQFSIIIDVDVSD